MMKGERIVRRVSIGFTAKEWDLIDRATRLRYSSGGLGDMSRINYTDGERNHMLRIAIEAVCRAMLKQGWACWPLACDLRAETQEERIERVGVETAAQLGWLPEDSKPGPDSPDNVLWFRS